jgi:Flp pilus assembly protein CpaB
VDDLDYRDQGRRGKRIVIIGVILAVVAGGAAYFLLNQAQQQAAATGVPTVKVVVAAREILSRKPIEEADLSLRDVPQDVTNASAYTATADVVGRISAVTIPGGQLVTRNLLASPAAGGEFSILEPDATIAPDSPNLRAISLNVPDDRAVGGLVTAGENVDVFATVTVNVMTANNGKNPNDWYTDKSTKVTYQDLPVLAKSGTFYIVRVDEKTAEEISHLQASGAATFSMALRPPEDTRTVDTKDLGQTTNRIIELYGLPIPVVYPRPGTTGP